jgi:hypothetical protein
MLASPELQALVGKKYCNEAELLPLLLAHGCVREVETIEVTVHPLGGDSFKVKLNAESPSVGETKSEISRLQGILEERQELFKVAVSADGKPVREDDEEPRPLDDDKIQLVDQDVVTFMVKEKEEPPLVWATCGNSQAHDDSNNPNTPTGLQFQDEASNNVTLSEDSAVATLDADGSSVVMSGHPLSEGRYYWEVELLSDERVLVGVCKPTLDPTYDICEGAFNGVDFSDCWFINSDNAGLYGGCSGEVDGDGFYGGDQAFEIGAVRHQDGRELDENEHQFAGGRGFVRGDRIGVMLDLNERQAQGSIQFFKNGVQHGPGFPKGSISLRRTGGLPVFPAIQTCSAGAKVRLLPISDASWPEGYERIYNEDTDPQFQWMRNVEQQVAQMGAGLPVIPPVDAAGPNNAV